MAYTHEAMKNFPRKKEEGRKNKKSRGKELKRKPTHKQQKHP